MKDKKTIKGIREIAELAGVSTATVSRVINKPETTSLKVREKVLRIIEEYNYVPNQMAKNLFAKTSNSIAIFVYDMSNPFFISVIKQLNNIAFENKYTLLICDTENNPDKEHEYLNYCQSIRVAGVVLTEGVNHNLMSNPWPGLKTVFLDRTAKHDKFSSVQSNNIKGISLLVDYLYNLNHRKIAFITGPDNMHSSQERFEAYFKKMQDLNLSIQESYIFKGYFSHKAGIEAIDYFCTLNDPPTAIICCNDQIAQGVLMRSNTLGINIPNDMSLVGFDAIKEAYFYPKITSIHQDTKKIAEALFHSIVDNKDPATHHLIDVSISIGTTCKKI